MSSSNEYLTISNFGQEAAAVAACSSVAVGVFSARADGQISSPYFDCIWLGNDLIGSARIDLKAIW